MTFHRGPLKAHPPKHKSSSTLHAHASSFRNESQQDSGGKQIPLLHAFQTWNQDSASPHSLLCRHQSSLFVPSRKFPLRGRINLSDSPALIRSPISQHPYFLSHLTLSVVSNESYPIVRLYNITVTLLPRQSLIAKSSSTETF